MKRFCLLFANFNPRSPHGERRNRDGFHPCAYYFNPRSPHGERQFAKLGGWDDINISIHAPRTGSDEAVSVGV